MKLRWQPRTSLFARMSLLFGLLVTVPLVISGIVLSLVGGRSVVESGNEVAAIGTLQLDLTADKFQREAEIEMRQAGKDVAKLGKERLGKISDQALQAGKRALLQNTGQMTERGKEAVSKATHAVVEVGQERLKSSLENLAQANSDSLTLLDQKFRDGMERELNDSSTYTAIRENLERSSRRSWELSAERRLTAVKDRAATLQNNIVNNLQYPLNTWEVVSISKDAPRSLALVRKNRPEVVRVMLVQSTGSEMARIPDTDPAVGEDVDWLKEGSREKKTFDAIQSLSSVVNVEPLWYDERSKMWLRRIVHKVPTTTSTEIRSDMMMAAPADGAAMKPLPVPFVVVDAQLDKVLEDITRELPDGMNLMVIQAGTGKVVLDTDEKENPALVKSILEKLPTGEDAEPFRMKPKDLELVLENGTRLLARAMYWDPPDNCWTVVTQPETVVLQPLIALQNGIRNAWQQSLTKVNGESKQLIRDRTRIAATLRSKLIREAEVLLASHEAKEQRKVADDLKRLQDEMVRRLDAQLAPEITKLRAEAEKGMESQAAARAADAFARVRRASETWTQQSAHDIRESSRQVANHAAGQMLSYSAWLIPLFLVLALFLATLTARSLVRPINQLVKGTQALASGDYSRRIKIQGGDNELARLALAFNEMAGAIETGQAQLQQSHDFLAAEKARIQGIVESSPDGLVMLEPTGQVAFINPAAARLLGLSPNDIPPAPFEVSELPPAAARRLQESLEQVRSSEGVQECDWHEPQRMVLQLREVNLRSASGRSYGRLLHLHDITRERVIDEMKTDFISLVSHELRTPLTSILGFSSYMLTGRLGPVQETQKTALESIHRQAKRLSAIISDFLDVSRIESGKIEMKKEPVQIKNIAGRVVDDLRPQAAEKRIRVTTRVEDESLPLVALGDEQRIAQVFTNLVGNALKFTEPDGAIDVTLARSNGDVICKVRDTGCGIPPDELDRVFDRFYQVEKVVTRKSGGTGLGLAIVKNIVEAHGGRISISSTLGEGTEVCFTLPGSDPTEN